MPTLTIKNLPPDTYRRLKRAAAAHRRSLNSEMIVCLERALGVRRSSPAELRPRAAELRAAWQGAPLTMKVLGESKRSGRS